MGRPAGTFPPAGNFIIGVKYSPLRPAGERTAFFVAGHVLVRSDLAGNPVDTGATVDFVGKK